MGYILPITHFEYINYQNRIIKDKETSHQIDALYKVILELKQNKEISVYNKKETDTNKNNEPNRTNKINIELTGKGRCLDIQV